MRRERCGRIGVPWAAAATAAHRGHGGRGGVTAITASGSQRSCRGHDGHGVGVTAVTAVTAVSPCPTAALRLRRGRWSRRTRPFRWSRPGYHGDRGGRDGRAAVGHGRHGCRGGHGDGHGGCRVRWCVRPGVPARPVTGPEGWVSSGVDGVFRCCGASGISRAPKVRKWGGEWVRERVVPADGPVPAAGGPAGPPRNIPGRTGGTKIIGYVQPYHLPFVRPFGFCF